jgi:CRP/FNR family transcriptional regulator, cyclic AMP receptor protein
MRLGHDEKIETIKKVPLFGHCTKKELAAVARLADEIDLPAGKVLTRQGERGHEFLVIIDGTADVERDGEKIAELGPGDFFGEMGLVGDTRRNATVVANTSVKVVVMTAQAFRQTSRELPEVADKIRAAIEERCRHLEPA